MFELVGLNINSPVSLFIWLELIFYNSWNMGIHKLLSKFKNDFIFELGTKRKIMLNSNYDAWLCGRRE
jgi:hypothetical protein